MRLIFVNFSHPEVDHVAGTRLREFAHAMARRGHRVVLVSSTLPESAPVPGPAVLARAMDAHDWTHPFHIACASVSTWYLAAARSGRLPAPLRRAVSLWSLVLGDGPWHDWVAGSKPYWPLLARHSRPDVVWGNFGSVSDLVLAQALAREAGVPWCADVKDNMQSFLPASTRPVLARRFANVAGMTANSQFHADKAKVVFDGPYTVIYSGIDAALLAVARQPIPREHFRILLVGSIYSDDAFARYLRGLERFAAPLPADQRANVELCYAGHDVERVGAGISRSGGSVRLNMLGYLSTGALCDAYAGAAVQSYIWSGATFHHKTVEMLATNRPVVAFPDEFDETARIAGTMRAVLHSPNSSDDLANVLGVLHRQWLDGRLGSDIVAAQDFTWDAGAEKLEQAFDHVLRERAGVANLAAQPAAAP